MNPGTPDVMYEPEHPLLDPAFQEESKKPRGCHFPKRYMIVVFCLFSILCAYTQRANLSTALLSIHEEMGWSESLSGTILSSFFIGYILFQVFGGAIATKFGGKIVLLVSLTSSSILTLLTPLAARNFYVFIALRILMGICQCVIYPTVHCLLSFWAAPSERGSFVGICWAGSAFGTLIAMSICGYLCDLDFLGGWPLCFYIFGILGLVWALLWAIYGADCPEKCNGITQEEVDYLASDMLVDEEIVQLERTSSMHINPYIHPETPKEEHLKTPWLSLILSPVALSIYFVNFSVNWGQFTMMTNLPIYIKKRFNPSNTIVGILTIFPYLGQGIMNFIAGSICDHCIKKGYRPINVRLGCQLYGNFMMALFLILTGYIDDVYWDTVVLSLAVMHLGFSNIGFGPRILDVAGHYSAEMMAISNTCGALPGVVSPLLVSAIVGDTYTDDQWRTVFFIAAGLLALAAILFFFFGKQNLLDFHKSKPVQQDVIEENIQITLPQPEQTEQPKQPEPQVATN